MGSSTRNSTSPPGIAGPLGHGRSRFGGIGCSALAGGAAQPVESHTRDADVTQVNARALHRRNGQRSRQLGLRRAQTGLDDSTVHLVLL